MNLPGFGLHPLKDDLAGYWAIKVSGQLAHHLPLQRAKCLGREHNLLPLGDLINSDDEPTPSGSIRKTRLPGTIDSKRDGSDAQTWYQLQATFGHRELSIWNLARDGYSSRYGVRW